MKINRNILSRMTGYMLTAGSVLLSFSSGAQQADSTESPMMITFTQGEGLAAGTAEAILAERLHINKGTDELRSAYIERPDAGVQVQRFHQYFKGVRVAHGTYTLTSKNGIASFAFGKYFPTTASMSVTPKLDESSALASAINHIHAEKYAWDSDPAEYPKATTTFIEDLSTSEGDGVLHLAYAFDIYAAEPMSRNMVYVDATTGKVLFADAILKHAVAKGASLYSDTVTFNAGFRNSRYYLHDSTRGTGVFTYNLNNRTYTGSGFPTVFLEDSSATSTFDRDPAVDAHWGASRVYDYWKSTHNRDSWNGSNAVLRSYVHYGSGYNNAFWNGSAMFYGDGTGSASGGFPPLTALDVCAHEIGHGVCQSTAGLVYSRESGGMNEAFSDIWGAVIEAYGDPKERDATAKDPWLIGEELINTLRSMKNPKQFGQPDCYQGAYWVCTSTTCAAGGDNWGVHTNSGVLNYWFYLLSVGGKGTNDLSNPYNVSAIGMTNAARIAYATELVLTPTSTYANCRTASIAAATTIFGACSPEVEAVTRAWYAVGVGGNYSPCTPQVSFDAPTTTYSENAAADACRPAKVISVPVVLGGPALTGGPAIVTASVIGGTAIAGVDYDLTTPAVTFTVGGPTTMPVQITVYDNGALNTNKYIDLTYTLSAGVSNASKSAVLDTTRVAIVEDDRAPDAGVVEQRNVLINNLADTVSSPFFSRAAAARLQYIYRAEELSAAGIRPGVPLTAADFFVTAKSSTQPFQGYTVQLAHTAQSSLQTGFITSGFTTVHSSNYTTIVGWNQIPFSTPFVWNGVDNIAVAICFTNTSRIASNDRVQAQLGSYTLAAYSATNATATAGCTLPFNVNNLMGRRPVLRFTQDIPATPVETALNSNRTWDVKAFRQVYFYNETNGKVIAGIAGAMDTLGCVMVKIAAAGNGFVKANSGSGNRSVKEYLITRTAQSAGSSYDAVFYLTKDELNGTDPYALKIVQSNTATDVEMLPGNTNIVTPTTVDSIGDYYAFRASFTGFNRFFFIDGSLALSAGSAVMNSNELWTGVNPFHSAPVLHWNIAASERVAIRMYDVTGKQVYQQYQMLTAGRGQLTLSGNMDLAPGTYVLQVVRPSGVFTRQLVKQ